MVVTTNEGNKATKSATNTTKSKDALKIIRESKSKQITASHGDGNQSSISSPPSTTSRSSLSSQTTTSVKPPEDSIEIRYGKTVELHDGSFLRVTKIVKRAYHFAEPWFLVKGALFRRSRALHSIQPIHPNYRAVSEEEEDGVNEREGLPFPNSACEVVRVCDEITVPIEDIVRLRKLVVTNAEFPRFSNKGIDGWLTCRWKYCQGGNGYRIENKDGGEENIGDSELSTAELPRWERITAKEADLCYRVVECQ